jgi:hypothetical protein
MLRGHSKALRASRLTGTSDPVCADRTISDGIHTISRHTLTPVRLRLLTPTINDAEISNTVRERARLVGSLASRHIWDE